MRGAYGAYHHRRQRSGSLEKQIRGDAEMLAERLGLPPGERAPVRVTADVSSVDVSPASFTLNVGQTRALSATAWAEGASFQSGSQCHGPVVCSISALTDSILHWRHRRTST